MIIYLQVGILSYIGCGEATSDPKVTSPQVIDTSDASQDTSSGDTSNQTDTDDSDTDDTNTQNRDFLYIDEIPTGTIFVTEIMKAPLVDGSYGEWFEIYNQSSDRINLVDLIIRDEGGDEIIVSEEVYIEAMAHFVFGADNNTSMNGGVPVDFQYDRTTFALGNNDDEVILQSGDLELDSVSYDESFPNVEGVSLSLNAVYYSASNNNTSTNWCEGDVNYGAGGKGTPGEQNPTCLDTGGDTGGTTGGGTTGGETGGTTGGTTGGGTGGTTGGTEDMDADGYNASVDCDDNDYGINPDADEIHYDGIDQDCDPNNENDADGDGIPADVYTDPNGNLITLQGGDCDDSNANISPNELEIDCDGLDNNCDGVIDEGSLDVNESFESSLEDAIDSAIDLNPVSTTNSGTGLVDEGDQVQVTGYISYAGDIDAYKFDFTDHTDYFPPDDDDFTCTVAGIFGIDLQIQLFDEDGDLEDPVNNSGVGDSEALEMDGAIGFDNNGTYTVIIQSISAQDYNCSDSYTLTCVKD